MLPELLADISSFTGVVNLDFRNIAKSLNNGNISEDQGCYYYYFLY